MNCARKFVRCLWPKGPFKSVLLQLNKLCYFKLFQWLISLIESAKHDENLEGNYFILWYLINYLTHNWMKTAHILVLT